MRTAILFLIAIACFGQTRVNVGGPQYTDAAGNIWAADTGCSSATTYTYTGAIRGTVDPTIYQTGRTDPSSLSCSYQVSTNTFYLVTLKFAEYNPSMTTGKRLMNVFINGAKYYTALDIFSMCGFAAACDQSPNPIPVSNTGVISVVVTQQQGQPMLAGIQITAIADGGLPLPASSQLTYLRVKPNTGNLQTLEFVSIPPVNIVDYNFTPQTPGGSLTGGGGSQTVTLAPCPLGTAGSDTNHYLYISGGTGTAEAVLLTGGSCTSGLSTGTVIFSPANNHTGAWTIQSGTAGFQEAANVAQAVSQALYCPAGSYNWYQTLTLGSNIGGIYGNGNCNISVNFTGSDIIDITGGGFPITFSNFNIIPAANMTTGAAISAPNVHADVFIDHVQIGLNGNRDAWTMIHSASPLHVSDTYGYALFRGIDMVGQGLWINKFHPLSDSNTGNYKSGSAALYMGFATGAWIDALVHDAGTFDNCITGDSSSNAVNEVQITNSYCDNWANHGIYMSSTANPIQNWKIVNSKFLDDTQVGGTGVLLSSAVSGFSLADSDISYSNGPGVSISGSNFVKLSNDNIYPEVAFTNASVQIGGSGSNHISITGSTLGISRDYPSNPATNGVLVQDSTANVIDVTANQIVATNPVKISSGDAGGTMNVFSNRGVDDIIPTVASASTVNLCAASWYTRAIVSGTTQITTLNCNAGNPQTGQQVTLTFTAGSPAGLGTGGNIRAAHSVSTGQSVTLYFDGADWD